MLKITNIIKREFKLKIWTTTSVNTIYYLFLLTEISQDKKQIALFIIININVSIGLIKNNDKLNENSKIKIKNRFIKIYLDFKN